MNAASKLTPLPDSQIQVQGSCKQDGPCGHGRSREIIACEKASRILRVGQRYVEENALQDDEDPKGVNADADNADDVMDVTVCRLTEEEEANRKAEGGVLR